MKDIEGYDKLASLSFRMDCGIGLLDVIYECVRRGQFDTDMFAPAVYAALEYFNGLNNSLKQLKEEALAPGSEQKGAEEAPVQPREP